MPVYYAQNGQRINRDGPAIDRDSWKGEPADEENQFF